MDYYTIGQTIRKFRKAQGLSQESLSEMINISVTHMSHIETGNTKLSLPVFIDIANALHVSADDLLGGILSENKSKSYLEIAKVIDCCSTNEAKVIVQVAKAAKAAMDQYF